MSKLTIVILTYNSQNIISLSLAKLDQDKYKIIVVDNASTDNTVKIIEEKFPNIKIIQTGKNIGFSRANNIALKQIDTKFALVLNPDCFIENNDIDKIIKAMEENPNIAIGSAVAYNCNLDEKTNKLINTKPCEIGQRNLLQDKGSFFTAKFITGACMFMRMDVFQKIGFFDEKFFMYCEDNEINKRTKNNGYDIAIIKDTKFFHLGGKSSTPPNSEILYFIEWHKFGWSKMYYTEAVHNKFIAKLKSIRKIMQILIKMIIDLIKYKRIHQTKKATLSGSVAYLIGMNAFDKNDNPRRKLL